MGFGFGNAIGTN
jgi:hypothetical protein